MPPTTARPPGRTPPPGAGSTGGRLDVRAWLRSPQGKVTAGAAAAAVVVALALRRRAQPAPAGAIVPAVARPAAGGGGGASGGTTNTPPPATVDPGPMSSPWRRLQVALNTTPPTITAARVSDPGPPYRQRTLAGVAWDAIPGAAAVAGRLGGTAPAPAPDLAPAAGIGAGATLARITSAAGDQLRRLTSSGAS